MSQAPNDAYAALRIPAFRTFTLTRFLLTLAIQIQSVAVGLHIYYVTKDPLALGMIGLSEAIPSIGVALYAGHVADVWSRRTIIFWALSAVLLCSLGLLVLTQLEISRFDVRPVYAIIFLSGFARGFLGPAVSGMAAQIIPAHLYANGSAWSSSTWQTASVVGPALGGLLYGFGGAAIAYTVNASLILLAIIFMTMVPPTPIAASRDGASVKDSIREGLRFVFSNQIVLSALALDLFAVLFGGAIALLPVFAVEVLHVDKSVVGLLRAAPAAGAVMTGLWLAHRPLKGAVGRRLLIVVAGFGLCMIAFALSRNVYLSFAILALSGSFDSVSVVIRSTLLQQLTPDEMRGRVSAVNSIFVGSSNEIGEFESGVIARLMGVVPSVVFGGCMTLLVVMITFFAAPKLRDLKW